MKRHIRDFVRRFLRCQQVKAEDQKATRLLQPLEVAEWKWGALHDGFCDPLSMDTSGT